MIAVVTDSCASIPPPLVSELDIEIVPYYVHYKGRAWRDSIDISPEEFLAYLTTASRLPTSANPGPGDYLHALKKVYERASHVVIPTMTSSGSGAYQAAMIAREMAASQLPGLTIDVIDTRQVSMVHGWAAVEAARAAKANANFAQVVATVRYVAANGHMIQTADTLKYLFMGGRIGRAKHLVGSMLSVKPLIGMDDGVIIPLGQARSLRKAFSKMIDLMKQFGAEGRRIRLCVTHAAAPDRAADLLRQVSAAFDCAEVHITHLSSALAVHTGPGLVGVNFFPIAQDASHLH
jgi:DegV family protein with EDD domain